MSGTQKKRATARPAMPWLSICAALVAVGSLLLLQERSAGSGSQPSRTASGPAPALRQALFGAGVDPVSGTSTAAADEHGSADAAALAFDAATIPVSASNAVVSDPSGALVSGEPESTSGTTPIAVPASAPASRPAD